MALLSSGGGKATPGGIGFDDHDGAALVRAIFIDSRNPDMRLTCLFNPNELPISKEAEWGELNPIGWSSTTQQYAFTKSAAFGLNLVFSRVAMLERGLRHTALQKAISFFNYFLHSAYPGRAPSFMLMSWPKTLNIICRVGSVTTTYKRWSQRGLIMEYGIGLSLVEVRQSWLSSGDVAAADGWPAVDGSLMSSGVESLLTGRSIKLSGGNR